MKKGLLIILSGPSGVGKGTVRQEIMKDKSLNLIYSISMTTRPARAGEINGVDYYFVDRRTFEERISSDNFLEYAEFVGNYYGTPRDKVEKLREQGSNVFLEIETWGASQVLSKVKDPGVISFFLMPPNFQALEDRIRNRRSESEEVIKERLDKGRKEMALADNYDYVITNDSVERAAQEIKSIIAARLAHL